MITTKLLEIWKLVIAFLSTPVGQALCVVAVICAVFAIGDLHGRAADKPKVVSLNKSWQDRVDKAAADFDLAKKERDAKAAADVEAANKKRDADLAELDRNWQATYDAYVAAHPATDPNCTISVGDLKRRKKR